MTKKFGIDLVLSKVPRVLFVLVMLSGCGTEANNSVEKESRNDAEESPVKWVPQPVGPQGSSEQVRVFEDSQGVLSTGGTFKARIGSWQKGPQVTLSSESRNEFHIEIADATGLKLSQFELLDVSPFMKIHGHGVPKSMLPKLTRSENGVLVSNMGFIMSGPWEIKVKLKIGSVEDNLELPVVVP